MNSFIKFITTPAVAILLCYLSFSHCSEDVSEYIFQYTEHRLPKCQTGIEQTLIIDKPKFVLHLDPDQSLVTDDTNIVIYNASEKYVEDASRFSRWRYQGHVNDDFNNSEIFGAVDEKGQFHGSFVYNNVTYFIEPSSTYADSINEHLGEAEDDSYKAIMYESSDVLLCRQENNTLHNINGTGCEKINGSNHVRRRQLKSEMMGSIAGEMAKYRDTRKRRPSEEKSSKICDIKIVVDYSWFKNVADLDRDKAVNFVVSIMSKVDTLFREVDLDGDGRAENLGFYIDSIEIYLDPPTDFNYSAYTEWNPVQFFKELKRYDFSGACAGLLFTYRKMQSLDDDGPSIIKSTFNTTKRGICSSNVSTEIPIGVMDNYGYFINNAVPINFMRRGKPFFESKPLVIQAAHQLAQLFGAPTDDDTDKCSTTDQTKMNIMAYPVPSGAYYENLKFSQCSKNAIINYLKLNPRFCLRICDGLECSVKRSLDFLTAPYEITVATTTASTVCASENNTVPGNVTVADNKSSTKAVSGSYLQFSSPIFVLYSFLFISITLKICV